MSLDKIDAVLALRRNGKLLLGRDRRDGRGVGAYWTADPTGETRRREAHGRDACGHERLDVCALENAAIAILNVGRMNERVKQQAYRLDENVHFAEFSPERRIFIHFTSRSRAAALSVE
jgi:hypothetical protein